MNQVEKPRKGNLTDSQKVLLAQGALSSTFFSIGTGNFLAGYLLYLGAQRVILCCICAAACWHVWIFCC